MSHYFLTPLTRNQSEAPIVEITRWQNAAVKIAREEVIIAQVAQQQNCGIETDAIF